MKRKERIIKLKKSLEEAIAKEKYELASRIRDEIIKLGSATEKHAS